MSALDQGRMGEVLVLGLLDRFQGVFGREADLCAEGGEFFVEELEAVHDCCRIGRSRGGRSVEVRVCGISSVHV